MKTLAALAGAMLALCARPAHAREADGWDKIKRMEIAWQALNLADLAETETCLRHRDGCHEANPLMGRDPSTGKLVAVKLGGGLAHYLIARAIAERDPHAARLFEWVSLAVQGGVVAANLRFVF
jgi:hypothetical protein